MSEALIVRRGGSGLSVHAAVLHVNAPTGSTITLAKGGVTVKVLDPSRSHVNAEKNTRADWYYCVSPGNYGTWTVTATRSSDTVSKTISIDSNVQYEVELTYDLFIVKDGVALVSATSSAAYYYTSGDSYYIGYRGDGYSSVVWFGPLSSELLDGIVYRAFHVEYKSANNYPNDDNSSIGIASKTNVSNTIVRKRLYGNSPPCVLSVDCSSVALEGAYPYVRVKEASGNAYIKNIWFSREAL